ncbi:transposase [Belnapia sp. T6]|uniref:Transposase n=1 Tax=Belnapia mucosa TaxID=2804532 RepID=A0ABS1VD66_9PROT|nr:transposase [Belnapia mucosa]
MLVGELGPLHGLSPQSAPQNLTRNFSALTGPGIWRQIIYVDPPTHAAVLSIDEKSQIQTLDRTQPGLPLKPGRCGTMTHDCVRHGTTTLFAALNVLDGTVGNRCVQFHRREEFIHFLDAAKREIPAGKLVHAVVDNYATHKHPKVKAWLERHPRWTFHVTPTSGS